MNKNIYFHPSFAALVWAVSVCSCGSSSDGDSNSPFCSDDMVPLSEPGSGTCIDATEVTNAQFVEFLNEHGNECDGFECMHVDEPGSRIFLGGEEEGDAGPEIWEVEQGYEDYPVVQVNFHGAMAACEDFGKVLCDNDVWEEACTGGQSTSYPYGDSYEAGICNGGEGNEDGAPVEVASMPDCEGGEDGLFDMSGNVYEWTTSCETGPCLIRGGSFDMTGDNLSCESAHEMDGPSGHREDLGFRCCLGE